MFILNFYKKHMKRLGIYRPDDSIEFNRLNSTNLAFITIYCVSAVFMATHTISSKTIEEVSMSFTISSSMITVHNAFWVLVLQTPNIYKLIDNFEMIIQKREFKTSN